MSAPRQERFDLFVSYAHEDDRQQHAGRVTALIDAIRTRHAAAFPNDPLKVFFDVEDIVSGDYWQEKILQGLEQSAVMVAVLSPNYFDSPWCRKEWETFTQLELQRTYPGEAISPIYVLRHPDFDADESQVRDDWLNDLKNRQYIEWLPYFPHGAQALEQEEVRKRLSDWYTQTWNRIQKVRSFRRQPWNIPTEKNQIFVGRDDDLRKVNERLMTVQTVGVTAVSGFGGVGKTTLALRYAQRFRDHYPGGVLYVSCDSLQRPEELRSQLLDLAPLLLRWPDMTDDERARSEALLAELTQRRRTNEDQAYRWWKSYLESGDRKLLVFDNVSDPALVSASARQQLPAPQNVRQLFTTRLGASDLGGLDTYTLDLLSDAAALDLLCRWRPFERDSQDPDYRAYCRGDIALDTDSLTEHDAEWKHALAIVQRVERLTIAVEVIGVHLSLHSEITLWSFLAAMQRKGIGAKLNDAGRDAKVQAWIHHPVTLMGPLLEPTLAVDGPAGLGLVALRALEYAAWLPKDYLPLNWLRQLVAADADTGALFAHDRDAPDPWLAALDVLADRQLLHRTSDGSSAFPIGRMHQILQEVVIDRTGRSAPQRRSAVIEKVKLAAFDIDNAGYFTPITASEFPAVERAVQRHRHATDRDVALTMRAMVTPLMSLGRLQAAATFSREAHDVLQASAQTDPANAEWQRDLSVSHNKIGDVHLAQGDLPRALAAYEAGLKISERLAQSDPANAEWQRDLSISHNKIGDVHLAQGDLPRALAAYEADLKIRERLAQADRANAEWQRDLSVSHNKIGDVHLAQGDLPRALAAYEAGLKISERLAQADPANAEWQRDLSISHNNIGDVHHAQGDLPRALAAYHVGLKIRERLTQADPANAVWQRDLSVSYWRFAMVTEQLATGASRDWWQRAYQVLQRMHDRNMHLSPQDLQFMAQIRVKLQA